MPLPPLPFLFHQILAAIPSTKTVAVNRFHTPSFLVFRTRDSMTRYISVSLLVRPPSVTLLFSSFVRDSLASPTRD